MTETQTIIVAVLIVVAFAAILIAMRGSGPRVTHIDTRRDNDGTGE